MNDQRMYGMLPPRSSRLRRKERKSLPPAKRPPSPPRTTATASTTVSSSIGSKRIEVTTSNKLLAGYMAHEFRTKGTLLGRKLDAARTETAERGIIRPVTETSTALNDNDSYKEITSLLMMKSDGGAHSHIPGIVNPSQLARIEM